LRSSGLNLSEDWKKIENFIEGEEVVTNTYLNNQKLN